MYIIPNELNKNRLGISVSKKVGNSVVRHHLTRLIRESYRLSEEHFRCGYDIVVIARTSAKDKNYHDVEFVTDSPKVIKEKNEHTRRKKSSGSKKSKRKKTVISIGRIYVAFSSIYY